MDEIQRFLKGGLTFPLLVSLLVLILLAAYSNHFHNGFQFDDFHTIVSNEYVHDLGNIPKFFTDNSTMSTNPSNRSYRPVVATLNAMDWVWGGGDPFYFHLSIFASFLLLCCLIYFMFLQLFKLSSPDPWNRYYSLFGAAFFALHAANAETVNYIISRSDSFSTLCIVASVLLFMYRKRFPFLYLLPMILGIYTKQVGVVAIPLFFVYSFLFEEGPEGITFSSSMLKPLQASFRRILPALLVGLGLFLINQLVMTKGESANLLRNWQTSRWDYFTSQWYVMAHYVGNFILPVNLSADPDIKVIPTIWSLKKLLGFMVIALLLYIAFRTSGNEKTRPVAFGILWFFVCLFPTSTFHPLGQVSNDHRTFLPYIGLVMTAAWALSLLVARYRESHLGEWRQRAGLVTLCIAFLSAHAYGAHQRNKVWSSSDTLWEDVARKSPENGRGLMNYGLTLMRKGEYEETKIYFEKAMKLLPYYSYLHINMGVLKNAMGHPEEAEQYFKNAIRYQPSNAEGYYYYARFLWSKGRVDETLKNLEKGLKVSPGHTGLQSFYQGVKNGTIRKVDEKGRLVSPVSSNEFVNLSLKLYNQGEYESSIRAGEKALELDPSSAKAYNNICIANIRLGRYDEAIAAGEKALELEPGFSLARNNVRWAKSLRSKADKK